MKDPNTMTLDEIRDWLAERKGWDKAYIGNAITHVWIGGGDHHPDHPIPSTLDAAAAAMPEGWEWGLGRQAAFKGGYEWHWWAECKDDPSKFCSMSRTGNEITDRFRLAVLCILAEEASK